MTQYYTYILINSLDGQPFYVGKGSGNRMYKHLEEAQRSSHRKRSVHCKIMSIIHAGGTVQYQRVNWPSEAAAFVEEKRLISIFGRKDLNTGILCNLTEGGEGGSQSPTIVESRAAKHRGMRRSTEARSNMRKAQLKHAARNVELFGTARTKESKAKQSATTKGSKWSPASRAAVRAKPTAKPVLVHTTDGTLVGEYESISRAGVTLGCDATSIWRMCEKRPCHISKQGKISFIKSHKGYVFAYLT